MRIRSVILSLVSTAVLAVCMRVSFSLVHAQETPPSLQEHVRAIERAIADRSLAKIREYLNPKRTFIDIFGKPASYLSVNQSVAVIETFFRQNTPVSYSMGIIKEEAPVAIAISSLRVKSTNGERALKLTLGFSKDTENHWLVNRIIIR